MKNRYYFLIYNATKNLYGVRGSVVSVKNSGYSGRRGQPEDLISNMFTATGQTFNTKAGAINQLKYLKQYTKDDLSIVLFEAVPKEEFILVDDKLIAKNEVSKALYG